MIRDSAAYRKLITFHSKLPKKLPALLTIFLLSHQLFSQSSFNEVIENGTGVLHVHYYNIEPSCYEENGELKGIEYELIQSFAQYIETKHNITLEVEFFRASQFPIMYRTVKDGKSGMFGSGSLSITKERLGVINFTPSYFPDIEVLINSSNIPLVNDTEEFVKTFKNLTGLAVRGTTSLDAVLELKEVIPGFTIEEINDINAVLERLENEPNLFAYKQLSTYLLAKKNGQSIKRQNLFAREKEGGIGIAYPLNSDWQESIEAYFADSSFKKQKEEILKKYLGSDVNDIILELASTKQNDEDNVTLLNKELEFQNLILQKQKLEIGRQNLIRNIIIGGILFLLFISIILYRNFKLQQRNNQLLNKKNEEIDSQRQELLAQTEELQQLHEETTTQRDFIQNANFELRNQSKQINDSIKAAKKIQQALIPYDSRMKNSFEDFFTIYRPRDIVSGDFYWLATKDDKRVLAAVDCTGHGIPGAFTSMIGNILFDKALLSTGLTDPSDILNAIDADINRVLMQDQESEVGMDAGIVVLEDIEENEVKIQFCGAKRPLYYFNNSTKELGELKGSRKSLGSNSTKTTLFETQEINLPKGSILYLSSDGLIDQNNVKRKKFGKARLINLLENNALLSLTQQKKLLETALDEFQVGTTQRDDIIFVGIKI